MEKIVKGKKHTSISRQMEDIRLAELEDKRKKEKSGFGVAAMWVQTFKNFVIESGSILDSRGEKLSTAYYNALEGRDEYFSAGQMRRFTEETGFDGYLISRRGGLRLGEAEKTCEEFGFTDRKSYGVLMSLAHSPDYELDRARHRFFFAVLAPPLFKRIRGSDNPDGRILDFKKKVDLVDPRAVPGLYITLGENEAALDRFLAADRGDVEGFDRMLGQIARAGRDYGKIVK